jgi:hypothetical protein
MTNRFDAAFVVLGSIILAAVLVTAVAAGMTFDTFALLALLAINLEILREVKDARLHKDND